MPPKPRITREMILDAAFAIAREQGSECISARTIAERLGCSTQPVLYWFDHVEDVRREVYRMADEYHTACLMDIGESADPMMAIGLNYIRFASREKRLFRLLFQTDSFGGQGIVQMIDQPDMAPMLEILCREAGLTMTQAKQAFRVLLLLVHGWASMLANNTMPLDEAEIVSTLTTAFMGTIGALKMEGEAE